MFLMRADPLRGPVRWGWALEIESFLGPVKWHRADRRVPFRAQKLKKCGASFDLFQPTELLLHLSSPPPVEVAFLAHLHSIPKLY